jgi:hypothetical protein
MAKQQCRAATNTNTATALVERHPLRPAVAAACRDWCREDWKYYASGFCGNLLCVML